MRHLAILLIGVVSLVFGYVSSASAQVVEETADSHILALLLNPQSGELILIKMDPVQPPKNPGYRKVSLKVFIGRANDVDGPFREARVTQAAYRNDEKTIVAISLAGERYLRVDQQNYEKPTATYLANLENPLNLNLPTQQLEFIRVVPEEIAQLKLEPLVPRPGIRSLRDLRAFQLRGNLDCESVFAF